MGTKSISWRQWAEKEIDRQTDRNRHAVLSDLYPALRLSTHKQAAAAIISAS